MTRLLTLGGAALAAVTLTVVVVKAQEASSTPAAEEVELAERAAEEAREAAEQAVRQAEEAAEQARERAQAIAEEAQAAAERAAADATRAVGISADVFVPMPDEDSNPFGASDDVLIPGGPRRVQFFAKGPKWERRAADPEMMQMLELERKVSGQIAELVAKYKSLTDDDARRALAQDVMARVADQFTVRQSLRERELVELEEQVERLRGLHDKRNEQKERIIEDRVQQILREAEGLGWGEGGGEPGAPGWGEVGAGFGGAQNDQVSARRRPGSRSLFRARDSQGEANYSACRGRRCRSGAAWRAAGAREGARARTASQVGCGSGIWKVDRGAQGELGRLDFFGVRGSGGLNLWQVGRSCLVAWDFS